MKRIKLLHWLGVLLKIITVLLCLGGVGLIAVNYNWILIVALSLSVLIVVTKVLSESLKKNICKFITEQACEVLKNEQIQKYFVKSYYVPKSRGMVIEIAIHANIETSTYSKCYEALEECVNQIKDITKQHLTSEVRLFNF